MRLKDIRLGRKQAIGFAIVLVIMASANVFAIFQLRTVKNRFDEVGTRWFPTAVATGSIGRETSQFRTLQLQHALATDDSTRLNLAGRMVLRLERIESSQASLEGLITQPEVYVFYERYLNEWELYVELSDSFLGLSRSGDRERALAVLNGDMRVVFYGMVGQLEKLFTINAAALHTAAENADATFYHTRTVARLIFLAALLLAVFMAAGLARWITVPLRELAVAAESVADYNLDVRVEKYGDDEIGHLADSFNRMTDSLRQARDNVVAAQHRLESANTELEGKNADLEDALAQLREAQQQLVMSEKMAALGNLVAGVAHEINNPVGAVGSSADTSSRSIELLRRQLDAATDLESLRSDKRFATALDVLTSNNEITVSASQRITEIVRSLKNFARLDESEFQEVSIHEGLDSTLTLLQHETKRRIEVIKDYGEVPPVQCFPSQLNQVFMNLLANAAQSIDGEGMITVKTRAEGQNAIVEITDSGKGIPAENVARIFDPGFTTKGVGVGTGLGLSISYNIIKKHGGRIDAESKVGDGTTMRITMPIAQEGMST